MKSGLKKGLLGGWLCLMGFSALWGQDSATVLRPGAEILDGTKLQPYRAKYRLVAGGREIGIAVKEFQPFTFSKGPALPGAPCWRTVFDMRYQNASFVDEMIVHRKTFMPVLHQVPAPLENGGLGIRIALFDERGIKGSITPLGEGEITPISARFEGPVFLGGGIEHVLAALPLSPGFSVRLPSRDETRDWTATASVERLETLAISGEPFETWVVSVELAGMDGILWLIREPPYLIKRSSPSLGMEWQLIAFRVGDW